MFEASLSFCLDMLTLLHNAVRQELSSMYFVYCNMAELRDSLTVSNVKHSTIWFRTFHKVLVEEALKWHERIFIAVLLQSRFGG